MNATDQTVTVPWVIDGSGVPIELGSAGAMHLDYPAIITGWTMLADHTGTLEVDIRRRPFSRDVEAESITGSTPPRVLNAPKGKGEAGDLAGWDVGLMRDDVLEFVVTAADNRITRATLGLRLSKV